MRERNWAIGDHGVMSVAIRERSDVNPSGQRIVAWVVSRSGMPEHYDECEENARLMVAAPDLLAALERVTTPHWNDEDGCDCGAFRGCLPKDCRWAQARAAIKKASGR